MCSYNHILNPEIRKNLKINIAKAIIVFDEAHNVESMAEECCSMKLLRSDLENNF